MIKMPPLQKVPQEVIDGMREYRMKNPRPLLPCIDQTEDDVAGYYRAAEVGAEAVVRQGYGGTTTYYPGKITGKKEKAGRVYVDCKHTGGAAFYMKHGRNCFHPTGQTNLVVPTPEITAWIEKHPRGSSDYTSIRGPEHGPVPER